MLVKKSNIVWVFYFVTYLFMLLDTTDNFPFTEKLRLIRYVFLMFMLFLNIFEIKDRQGLYFSAFIFATFILAHTVLFGRVWINPLVAYATGDHFHQLILYLALTFLCARYCFWTDSKKEFLISSFFALALFMFWCYITHLNGFAPVRYLLRLNKIFADDERYGFTFGILHRSITANYASMTLIIGALLWEYRFQFKGFLWKYHQVIAFITCPVLLAILISAASRGEMLAVVLYFFTVSALKFKNKLGSPRARWIINFLVIIFSIIFLIGFSVSIFSEGSSSNRSENFSVNYNAFLSVGRKFLGMGYIEQHGFLNQAYRVHTWACDVFYLYIFFSTGIVGSILLGIPFLWLIIRGLSYSHSDTRVNIPMKALILVEIFINFFHCTFISYGYLTGIPLMILFMEYMYSVDFDSMMKKKLG